MIIIPFGIGLVFIWYKYKYTHKKPGERLARIINRCRYHTLLIGTTNITVLDGINAN